MQLALGYSWRALIGAELIAASAGIGYLILDAEEMSRPDVVIVGMLAIGIIGTAIDYITFLDGIVKKKSVKTTVGTYKIVWRIINAINPFFWLKTIIRTVATQRILDEVVYASINIVVTEFASLYKKSSVRLQSAA